MGKSEARPISYIQDGRCYNLKRKWRKRVFIQDNLSPERDLNKIFGDAFKTKEQIHLCPCLTLLSLPSPPPTDFWSKLLARTSTSNTHDLIDKNNKTPRWNKQEFTEILQRTIKPDPTDHTKWPVLILKMREMSGQIDEQVTLQKATV